MRSRGSLLPAVVLGLVLVAGTADGQSRNKKKKTTKPVAAAVKKSKDADVPAIGGTGVPVGYQGRTDHPTQLLSSAKYLRAGTGWDITTGPAHILWNPKDVATGSYTVTTTIDQLGTPKHPDSYGLFIGGSGLADSTQSYLYFLVRGSGELFVQLRRGNVLTGKIAWQKSPQVPLADAAGKASYTLSIKVDGPTIRFLVNGREVATLPKGDIKTDGIYGLRINHNLHVHVSPITVTKP